MRTVVLFIALLPVLQITNAQPEPQPEQLVFDKQIHDHQFDKRKVTLALAEDKHAIIKYNPISLTFAGLLFFYQKVISRQLSTGCPYAVSCSEFSRLAIGEYGILKGVALTADRLTRCTEFTIIDIHPLMVDKNGRIIDPVEKYKY